MPHIDISLYPGRDDATKLDIAQKVERLYASAFDFKDGEVSVSISEIPADEFGETLEQRFEDSELLIPSKFFGDWNPEASAEQ